MEVIGKTSTPPWLRSRFNGLAQIIVQSTREAGEFKLTATVDGLAPTPAVVPTQPCAGWPSVSRRVRVMVLKTKPMWP